jgi:hypothetical protein
MSTANAIALGLPEQIEDSPSVAQPHDDIIRRLFGGYMMVLLLAMAKKAQVTCCRS